MKIVPIFQIIFFIINISGALQELIDTDNNTIIATLIQKIFFIIQYEKNIFNEKDVFAQFNYDCRGFTLIAHVYQHIYIKKIYHAIEK